MFAGSWCGGRGWDGDLSGKEMKAGEGYKNHQKIVKGGWGVCGGGLRL